MTSLVWTMNENIRLDKILCVCSTLRTIAELALVLIELVQRSSHTFVLFFFQAEDGIRDLTVTGVQTCALPISPLGVGGGPARPGAGADGESGGRARAGGPPHVRALVHPGGAAVAPAFPLGRAREIGRASCRERV